MRHAQSLHRAPFLTSAQTPSHLAHSSEIHHTRCPLAHMYMHSSGIRRTCRLLHTHMYITSNTTDRGNGNKR